MTTSLRILNRKIK